MLFKRQFWIKKNRSICKLFINIIFFYSILDIHKERIFVFNFFCFFLLFIFFSKTTKPKIIYVTHINQIMKRRTSIEFSRSSNKYNNNQCLTNASIGGIGNRFLVPPHHHHRNRRQNKWARSSNQTAEARQKGGYTSYMYPWNKRDQHNKHSKTQT